MELYQNPLIDGLSETHPVRQWWEGRLEGDGDLGGWPSGPDRAALDSLREPAGANRVDRNFLVEVAREQYAGASMAVPAALGRLATNEARTVTTGHQLCLAGGPAFTFYKALTAVHMAQWLENRWGTPVVPV
ncbi:MAG: bacillithiol biosynthesis BshC, partial [Bacteroidota bacterium]|nr:bacillithiol biosynthesis BshC [Bacteroidota bacterium]